MFWRATPPALHQVVDRADHHQPAVLGVQGDADVAEVAAGHRLQAASVPAGAPARTARRRTPPRRPPEARPPRPPGEEWRTITMMPPRERHQMRHEGDPDLFAGDRLQRGHGLVDVLVRGDAVRRHALVALREMVGRGRLLAGPEMPVLPSETTERGSISPALMAGRSERIIATAKQPLPTTLASRMRARAAPGCRRPSGRTAREQGGAGL